MVTLCARIGWPEGVLGKVGAGVIKAVQPSPVFHVGVLLSDGYLYQSRFKQGVHRELWIPDDPGWRLTECPWADEDYAREYYEKRKGHGYDGLALLDWAVYRFALTAAGVSLTPGLQDPLREMCSEFAMGMLGYADTSRFSPSAAERECQYRTVEFNKL